MSNIRKAIFSIAFLLFLISLISNGFAIHFTKEEDIIISSLEQNKYCFKNNPINFNISVSSVIIDGNYYNLDVNSSYLNTSLRSYKISYNFTYNGGSEKGIQLFITSSTKPSIVNITNQTSKIFQIFLDTVAIDFSNELKYFNISYAENSSGIIVNITSFTTNDTVVIDPVIFTTGEYPMEIQISGNYVYLITNPNSATTRYLYRTTVDNFETDKNSWYFYGDLYSITNCLYCSIDMYNLSEGRIIFSSKG